MSQHTFEHGHYSVLCGFDRPMQGFFLVIEDDRNDEDVAYSNLYEKVSHPTSFDPFVAVLHRFGIPIPDGLLVALDEDQKANKGNSIKSW